VASRKCCEGENTEEIRVAKQVVGGGLALIASFANLQLLANRRLAKYGRTKQGLSIPRHTPPTWICRRYVCD